MITEELQRIKVSGLCNKMIKLSVTGKDDLITQKKKNQ